MDLTRAGIEAIKRHEGCVLTAYRDVAGIWTVGYGHVEEWVTRGLVITQARAEELLAQDLHRFETGVSKLLKVGVSSPQFDAMVSLAFNIGLGAFAGSTLLKKLNAGDHVGACVQFCRWNKAGGTYQEGLALRRASEAYTFARGCP